MWMSCGLLHVSKKKICWFAGAFSTGCCTGAWDGDSKCPNTWSYGIMKPVDWLPMVGLIWQDTADNWFQYRSNPDRQSHCGFLGPRWSCVFSLGLAQLLPRSARQASAGVRYIMAVWGSFRYHVSSRCCCCLFAAEIWKGVHRIR